MLNDKRTHFGPNEP